jgi:hypothetical protein
MPSLVVLGKKSWFAGDDIRQPVLIGGIFRVIEIIISLTILVHVTTSSDQVEQQIYDEIAECVLIVDDRRHSTAVEDINDLTIIYAATSLVVAFIGLLEYIAMFRIAGKGNPTDIEPRKYMPMLFNINFTVTYFLRIATLVFGIFMASVFGDYCQCAVTTGVVDDDSRRLSTEFRDVKDQCWMYRETWVVAFFGLVICQAIDFFFGLYRYLSLLCRCVPTNLFIPAEAAWDCCCRCFVNFANCITCCTMGGLRAIGSSDTQEFAKICSKYFNSYGILDITFSDILAGELFEKVVG